MWINIRKNKHRKKNDLIVTWQYSRLKGGIVWPLPSPQTPTSPTPTPTNLALCHVRFAHRSANSGQKVSAPVMLDPRGVDYVIIFERGAFCLGSSKARETFSCNNGALRTFCLWRVYETRFAFVTFEILWRWRVSHFFSSKRHLTLVQYLYIRCNLL